MRRNRVDHVSQMHDERRISSIDLRDRRSGAGIRQPVCFPRRGGNAVDRPEMSIREDRELKEQVALYSRAARPMLSIHSRAY
jgi:hypothetical protein